MGPWARYAKGPFTFTTKEQDKHTLTAVKPLVMSLLVAILCLLGRSLCLFCHFMSLSDCFAP